MKKKNQKQKQHVKKEKVNQNLIRLVKKNIQHEDQNYSLTNIKPNTSIAYTYILIIKIR